MKSRKLWVGLPVIMLVFTVVFGVMFTSCEEPISEADLIGKWCTAADLANERVSFEFISGQKILSYDETYDYTKDAQNKFTFTKKGGAPAGTATFGFDPDGVELTVSGAADTKVVKNGKYYKLGYTGSTTDDTIAPPSAYPAGGIYTEAQSVTLTAAGAEIYYTTTGSDPKTSDTKYSTPISISASSVTLKAIAVKGGKSSDVLTQVYTISTTGSSSNVTVNTNSGDGSLRDLINKATDGAKIIIPSSITTITLTECLDIGKNIIIEGNGVQIKSTGDLTSTNKSLVNIQEGKTVSISGVRFSDGKELSGGLGGAIYNLGTLTLESCIFDGNEAKYGGAVYSTSKSPSTTVKGCTFYNNKATNWGGAIFVGGGNLSLTGNIFYGNKYTGTTSVYGPIVDRNDSAGAMVFSQGYNVVDKPFGTGKDSCGFSQFPNPTNSLDKFSTDAQINTTTFTPVTAISSLIPSSFTDMPKKYIDGSTRSGGAPGAVKP